MGVKKRSYVSSMETIILYSFKKTVIFMQGYVLLSKHFNGNKVISLIPNPMNTETIVRTGAVLILQTKSELDYAFHAREKQYVRET